MHPNHAVIKKLMTEHVTLTKVWYKLGDAGIEIEHLGDIDLFDIVMDLVGFPAAPHEVSIIESGKEIRRFERSKWWNEAYHLELHEIDSFLEKLYVEFNELPAGQPELFDGSDPE
ncbi:hypothetical protein [uncultured Chitinophaga sp.]|jgi:hypothetical protein|uniref:hypothetical protein n=1 Tax=uncultured Chitinophaga sp. TaxID=339340 RepID=UPI00261AAC4D|nr:hypothetical protein [uncultured Chitinophaga sp.]